MASTMRRLQRLGDQLCPNGCATNVGPPGDPGVVRAAHPQGDGQGYGPRASDQPPSFRPDQQTEALEFFREHRFLLIKDALSVEDLVFLNDFCQRTQEEKPQAWQIPETGRADWKSGIYLQPLLDHPELDPFMQHSSTFPLVDAILGHQARFAQFDFRETPTGAGMQKMSFHHDAALPQRVTRETYDPPDYLCTIHYLCDVLDESSPAFAVVPATHKKLTINEAKETMPDYVEIPLYGKAGTACFYDIACCAFLDCHASVVGSLLTDVLGCLPVFMFDVSATDHTRLDGDGHKMRRTMQHYFSRGGWVEDANPVRTPAPPLTDWVLQPQRLVEHPDPKMRVYYSHFNTTMGEYKASDYDEELRAKGVFGDAAAHSMGGAWKGKMF